MADWMKNTSPEERKSQSDKMMTDWMAWTKNITGVVDGGKPLGKTKRVTKEGVADVKNDLNYYMIVNAESHDAATAMLKDCPHYMIPNAYVEVMEVPHMS
jgi:hypothetical protein